MKLYSLCCTVVDCGVLSDPTHGKVKVLGTEFNSLATYSCNGGYVLTGRKIRVCLETAHWSDTAPVCTSEYTFDLAHTLI